MRNVSECLYLLYAWFFIVSSVSWLLSRSRCWLLQHCQTLNASLCTDPISDITVFVLKWDAKLQPTNLMHGPAHLNIFILIFCYRDTCTLCCCCCCCCCCYGLFTPLTDVIYWLCCCCSCLSVHRTSVVQLARRSVCGLSLIQVVGRRAEAVAGEGSDSRMH